MNPVTTIAHPESESTALGSVYARGKRLVCRALLVVPLALWGVACTVAAEATAPSGVTGHVSVSNSCPGPQKINQPPCASALADAKLVLRKANGAVAAKTTAASDGSFTLHGPPGDYVVQVEIEGLYPRCPEVELTIAKGRLAKADVVCDSGMR